MLRLPPDLWLTVVALVFVGAGMLLLICAVFGRRPRTRTCPRCRYDLSGVPGRTCPECGRTARSERHLYLRRPSKWRLAAAGLLLVLGATPLLVPSVAARAKSYTPNVVLYWIMPSLDTSDPLFAELEARLLSPQFTAAAQSPGPPTWSERVLIRRCMLVLARDEHAPLQLMRLAETTLVRLGPKTSTESPRLFAMLGHPNPHTRHRAVWMLWRLYNETPSLSARQVHEGALRLLTDSDRDVAVAAVTVLGHLAASDPSHDAFPDSLSDLWDRDLDARMRAVVGQAIAFFAPSPARDRLLENALAQHAGDRAYLAVAAGRPPVSPGAQGVLATLANDPDDRTRLMALREWASNGALDEALFAHLHRLAESDCEVYYPWFFSRDMVLTSTVLRAGPTDAAWDLLRTMLRSPELWQSAVSAAEALGPASRVMLPDLRRAHDSIYDGRFDNWECTSWNDLSPDAPERLEALIRTLEASDAPAGIE